MDPGARHGAAARGPLARFAHICLSRRRVRTSRRAPLKLWGSRMRARAAHVRLPSPCLAALVGRRVVSCSCGSGFVARALLAGRHGLPCRALHLPASLCKAWVQSIEKCERSSRRLAMSCSPRTLPTRSLHPSPPRPRYLPAHAPTRAPLCGRCLRYRAAATANQPCFLRCHLAASVASPRPTVNAQLRSGGCVRQQRNRAGRVPASCPQVAHQMPQ